MTTFFSKSRNPGDAQEPNEPTVAAAADEAPTELEPAPMPPFVAHGGAATRTMTAPAPTAPGVVPPAATPVYSVTAPAPLPRSMPPVGSVPHSVPVAGAIPRLQGVDENPVERSLRMAREAQEKVRMTLQGRRSGRQGAPGQARVAARQPVAARSRRPLPRTRMAFDPGAYAQTGLLNLAHDWQQAGASVRAIHAYMQVLIRYPGTPAADAAVADLVEFAEVLAGEGHFHTALSIYDQLEELM